MKTNGVVRRLAGSQPGFQRWEANCLLCAVWPVLFCEREQKELRSASKRPCVPLIEDIAAW